MDLSSLFYSLAEILNEKSDVHLWGLPLYVKKGEYFYALDTVQLFEKDGFKCLYFDTAVADWGKKEVE